MDKQSIIKDIKDYIKSNGGSYNSWYVGVTKDAKDRLFKGHKVDEKLDYWIYRTATSAVITREIEDYFISTLKTDGGSGGGDKTANMIYAYKKSKGTEP